jgi:DNA-binding NtrC family response regulator
LRERREDIPLLIDYFIKRYSKLNNKTMAGISHEALELCQSYEWPGNVRELENAVENAVVLGEGDMLLSEHLPVTLTMRRATADGMSAAEGDEFFPAGSGYREKMETAERKILEEAIRQANGNKSEAAKHLGISLRTMRYKIQKYKL